ncbi:hypothetical protein CXF85_17990 [Colwellia sp. 75C3]|uniref:hypothetical protein n=1 Tax=Colwellia sp. 75C3 TaxID=888425 RepID=UPI000C33BF19|nr:hypothetical protein [Colwellia sp. 75C3]PKG81365.1 hypothetical protein CXF85_17990 [Colwellia sp. 75C3]
MQDLVDDFIKMNQAGQVLALCEKYYHDDVTMLSNGDIFARTMREAYELQKGFVASIESFDIQLISQQVSGNTSELVFNYKMIGVDETLNEFTGKHIQTWQDNKIIREEYLSV